MYEVLLLRISSVFLLQRLLTMFVYRGQRLSLVHRMFRRLLALARKAEDHLNCLLTRFHRNHPPRCQGHQSAGPDRTGLRKPT